MTRLYASLCLIGMLLSPSLGRAQTTYLQTSFDTGIPSGFALYDLDGNEPSTDMKNKGFAVGTPWVALKVDKDSNMVAASTSWYKKGAQSNDWMVTPAISIASAKAVVSWRAKASDKDYADGYKVYVSTTGNTPDDFDTAAPLLTVNKESADWTTRSLPLAQYEGKDVYIAFVNDSKDKAMLYIDDIFVGVPSSVGISLDFGRCYDGYGDIPVTGKVFATGDQPVNGYTIGFAVGGKSCEYTYNGIIQPGQEVAFELDETFYLDRNATATYTAWAKTGEDSAAVSGKLSAFVWKIVAEEVTGTWCQYCVRGMGAMNYMRQNDPEGFIGIAIHNDGSSQVPDSMAIDGEEYRKWIMNNYSMSGYPHCVVNRNAIYSIDPGYIPDACRMIKEGSEHYAGIDVDATVDVDGNIKAKSAVYFAKDFADAKFKLAYIIIENDVHRTHAETGIIGDYCGYDQINGYAGGSMGTCYGFEDLPGIIDADDIWYQDVARGYTGDDGYKGISDALPSQVSEDGCYTHEVEMTMPEKVLDWKNAELVVLLLDKNGSIANAEKCHITVQTDGIGQVNAGTTMTDDKYYTLQGVRVAHPQKGIYIHNGKKVVVR